MDVLASEHYDFCTVPRHAWMAQLIPGRTCESCSRLAFDRVRFEKGRCVPIVSNLRVMREALEAEGVELTRDPYGLHVIAPAFADA